MEKDAIIDKLKVSLRQSISDFPVKESVLRDNFKCSLHKQNIRFKINEIDQLYCESCIETLSE